MTGIEALEARRRRSGGVEMSVTAVAEGDGSTSFPFSYSTDYGYLRVYDNSKNAGLRTRVIIPNNAK